MLGKMEFWFLFRWVGCIRHFLDLPLDTISAVLNLRLWSDLIDCYLFFKKYLFESVLGGVGGGAEGCIP